MIRRNKNINNKFAITDGNAATARIAHKTNEICLIYPITPATQMGEHADQWSTEGKKNIFGTVPSIITMQSEAGVSGALHGALQTGALTTTFTSSQGLLLMIPNMYRIAAELTPTVFHVACRSVATHGMTIYSEHSDVMATRATGFAMLCSANVQETQDMALVAQAASLQSKIPFVHFFDGMRTSHSVSKIEELSDEQIKAIIDENFIIEHRNRRLTSDNPSVRGLIYGFDIFFQKREAVNKFYLELQTIVDEIMQRFYEVTGRKYEPLEYVGHPKAEKIIILMGSSADTAHETVQHLAKKGEKVGAVKVRLFRPFPKEHLFKILPKTCKSIAVLDRTKEPGSLGEPLYEEITTAFMEEYCQNEHNLKCLPKIIGGRYGICSKEFTPAMIKAIFNELEKDKPKHHFTIGITDDVTNLSLTFDPNFKIEHEKTTTAIFYGLGSDGTLSANKNTIKIIGEETDMHVQGYFLYDGKKSGSKTTSFLRLGAEKIRSEYLIDSANFIGCHQFSFAEKTNVLQNAAKNAIFLLNSHYCPNEIWDKLPCDTQQTIIDKDIKFYVIDAYKVAEKNNLGIRINTIMQTCFFALSKLISHESATKRIKETIAHTYHYKGDDVIKQNFIAVDTTLDHLFQVKIPKAATSKISILSSIQNPKTPFIKNVVAKMLDGLGDEIPISALPSDGSFPSHTTCLEKRNIAKNIPNWDPDTCIQCGQCSLVCPHAVLRAKQYPEQYLQNAPQTFKFAKLRGKNSEGRCFTLYAHIEDCTGCNLCFAACPVKNASGKKAINLIPNKPEIAKTEQEKAEFFDSLPTLDAATITPNNVRDIQYLPPMFEFSGACSGCGETPYVRLLSQLFGDRLIIGNACGCSSIFGGQLPTSPWTVNAEGRGPAWSSSLFEDNAEFAYGFLLATDKHQEMAAELLKKLALQIGEQLVGEIIAATQNNQAEINAQRARIVLLKQKLRSLPHAENNSDIKSLISLADQLTRHSIWGIGGDGWAYDIGYGGVDHVLASGRNIKLLVLDTEVYSNTGGQASKATPRGAMVKFAMQGKPTAKKDLGLMMITYGNIYVAQISLGANPTQAIRAIREAEAYNGPSLVIAYSHCIAHGIDMQDGLRQQKLAVKSGHWPLYRHNPERTSQGLNPFQLDSEKPSVPYEDYALKENRFKILLRESPKQAECLLKLGQNDIQNRWKQIMRLAS